MGPPKLLTRDFVLSCLAQFVFSSVLFILIPTIPIYLSRLGTKEAEIGILVGILSFFSLVPRPFVGKALLKIPEKKFMIIGSLLVTTSSLAYLIAPPFWPFLTVRAFHGIAVALFFTSSITFIANISPEDRRGQGLSYFYLVFNIAFALAPYLGMVIINLFNFTILFLVCIALSLCSLLITTKLGKMQGAQFKDLSLKDQALISRAAIPPAIMALLVNILWGALTAFFPLYAISHGVNNPGLFFAAFAIVLIIGRAFGGKILDIYNKDKIILPCVITNIISMVILSFSTTFPMFILVAVLWGMGCALLYPALIAYALDRAGSSRGPAMGTFTAIADLGTGMGSMTMGLIIHWTSYPVMFLCLAFTGLLNLLYFTFFVKKNQVDRSPYV